MCWIKSRFLPRPDCALGVMLPLSFSPPFSFLLPFLLSEIHSIPIEIKTYIEPSWTLNTAQKLSTVAAMGAHSRAALTLIDIARWKLFQLCERSLPIPKEQYLILTVSKEFRAAYLATPSPFYPWPNVDLSLFVALSSLYPLNQGTYLKALFL